MTVSVMMLIEWQRRQPQGQCCGQADCLSGNVNGVEEKPTPVANDGGKW